MTETRDRIVQDALTLARELAGRAMAAMRSDDPLEITTKADPGDFVTDIDRQIERATREAVLERFPDHSFHGEEYGDRPGVDWAWYCDPVDGTTNFSVGLGWHSFSLALNDADGPVVGVVADPRSGEVFSAVRGQGAWLNDAPLRPTPPTDPTGTVLLTELLSTAPWPGMATFLDTMHEQFVTTRIMGSSALSIANVAAGRGHTAIIGHYGAVDLMAAVLVAAEAGLEVVDETGAMNLFPAGGGILVTSPGIREAMFGWWTAARGATETRAGRGV